MRKLILIVILAFMTTQGRCDAIDCWRVFLNGKLIAYFNENDKNRYIRLKTDSVKIIDTITVKYCADTHCAVCITELTVWYKIERLLNVQGVEDCRPISFALNCLHFPFRRNTELAASYVEHRGPGDDYGIKEPIFYILFE